MAAAVFTSSHGVKANSRAHCSLEGISTDSAAASPRLPRHLDDRRAASLWQPGNLPRNAGGRARRRTPGRESRRGTSSLSARALSISTSRPTRASDPPATSRMIPLIRLSARNCRASQSLRESEVTSGGVDLAGAKPASGHAEMQFRVMIVDLQRPPDKREMACTASPAALELHSLAVQPLPLLPLRLGQVRAVQRAQRRAIPQIDPDRRDDHAGSGIHAMPADSLEIDAEIAVDAVPCGIVQRRAVIPEEPRLASRPAALAGLRIGAEHAAKQLARARLLGTMKDRDQTRMLCRESSATSWGRRVR